MLDSDERLVIEVLDATVQKKERHGLGTQILTRATLMYERLIYDELDIEVNGLITGVLAMGKGK